MKKILKIIIPLILVSLTVSKVYAQSGPDYYEHIPKFQVTYIINEDGTINATEYISYYFNSPRHGIYREIPLSKENQDGKKYLISVDDVSVKDENNNPIKFVNNSTKRELNLKIGDPNKTITGIHSYVIRYKISGAISYFSDHDEFYWNVTGLDWNYPILNATATVTFPEKIKDDVKIDCYTGSFGSSDSSCDFTKTDKTTTIKTTTKLNENEGLTVAVSFPKNIVSELYPEKDRSEFFANLIGFLIGIAIFGLYLVLPIVILVKSVKRRKKYRDLEKKQVAAWFDPPKTPEGRFLTAGEVGILYDRKGDIRDITASIIQLAQKGYLKLVDKSKKGVFKTTEYEFIKLKDFENDQNLQEHERLVLEFLFSKTDEISTKQIAKRTTNQSKIAKIYKEVSENLVKEGQFEKGPYKVRNTGSMILALGFTFFNPLLIIAAIFFMKSSARTKHGAESYAVVKSLENFVKSQDRQIEYQAKNQMFFEKLLPYATALGVEKIWLERFKDIDMQQSDWIESNTGTIAYASVLNNFNKSFTTTMATTSTRSSSGFSSGGGGGGFSGGGGGGGGGGSW